MMGITPRMAQVLAFLRAYSASNGGVMPTTQEIADALGLSVKSRSAAKRLLDQLIERGHVRRGKGARAIEIITQGRKGGRA